MKFAAFVVDVAGWFFTKLNPEYVYVVIAGGGLFILGLVVMVLLSLYDMWLGPIGTRQQGAIAASQRKIRV